MTFCVYQNESKIHHMSWVLLKPQPVSIHQRNSDEYYVGNVPLNFDRFVGFSILKGHQMDMCFFL